MVTAVCCGLAQDWPNSKFLNFLKRCSSGVCLSYLYIAPSMGSSFREGKARVTARHSVNSIH